MTLDEDALNRLSPNAPGSPTGQMRSTARTFTNGAGRCACAGSAVW